MVFSLLGAIGSALLVGSLAAPTAFPAAKAANVLSPVRPLAAVGSCDSAAYETLRNDLANHPFTSLAESAFVSAVVGYGADGQAADVPLSEANLVKVGMGDVAVPNGCADSFYVSKRANDRFVQFWSTHPGGGALRTDVAVFADSPDSVATEQSRFNHLVSAGEVPVAGRLPAADGDELVEADLSYFKWTAPSTVKALRDGLARGYAYSYSHGAVATSEAHAVYVTVSKGGAEGVPLPNDVFFTVGTAAAKDVVAEQNRWNAVIPGGQITVDAPLAAVNGKDLTTADLRSFALGSEKNLGMLKNGVRAGYTYALAHPALAVSGDLPLLITVGDGTGNEGSPTPVNVSVVVKETEDAPPGRPVWLIPVIVVGAVVGAAAVGAAVFFAVRRHRR